MYGVEGETQMFQRDSKTKTPAPEVKYRMYGIDPMRKILTYFVDDWLELTVDILDRYLTWCDKVHDKDYRSCHVIIESVLRNYMDRRARCKRRSKMIVAE
jgi:hypothetical protein